MKPEYIIIHDSASSFGDFTTINSWHKERGFEWRNPENGLTINCGYHWLIYGPRLQSGLEDQDIYNGLIVPGRPDHIKGAHCRAQGMNHKSIGVCFIADGEPTEKQKYAGKILVYALCMRHKIAFENVLGHREVETNRKDPRLNIEAFRKSLENRR